MKRLSKEFLTGFIFILTIVLLIYGIKFLKGLNVFEPEKTYYSIYNDIDGLQVGSSVNLNGFNICLLYTSPSPRDS